jgi:hypothetical protein
VVDRNNHFLLSLPDSLLFTFEPLVGPEFFTLLSLNVECIRWEREGGGEKGKVEGEERREGVEESDRGGGKSRSGGRESRGGGEREQGE